MERCCTSSWRMFTVLNPVCLGRHAVETATELEPITEARTRPLGLVLDERPLTLTPSPLLNGDYHSLVWHSRYSPLASFHHIYHISPPPSFHLYHTVPGSIELTANHGIVLPRPSLAPTSSLCACSTPKTHTCTHMHTHCTHIGHTCTYIGHYAATNN